MLGKDRGTPPNSLYLTIEGPAKTWRWLKCISSNADPWVPQDILSQLQSYMSSTETKEKVREEIPGPPPVSKHGTKYTWSKGHFLFWLRNHEICPSLNSIKPVLRDLGWSIAGYITWSGWRCLYWVYFSLEVSPCTMFGLQQIEMWISILLSKWFV
jgi:hypothetical protein